MDQGLSHARPGMVVVEVEEDALRVVAVMHLRHMASVFRC